MGLGGSQLARPVARLGAAPGCRQWGAPSCFSLRAVFFSCLCFRRYFVGTGKWPSQALSEKHHFGPKVPLGVNLTFWKKKSTLSLAGFPSFPGSTHVEVRQAEERAGVETQGEGVVLLTQAILYTHPRDSEEQSESPGHRPEAEAPGVSGHQMGERRQMTVLPGDGGLGSCLPPWLQSWVHLSPLCRLFRHQSTSSSFLCDILALHCSGKSWPLDAVLSVSLMTFPPSLAPPLTPNRVSGTPRDSSMPLLRCPLGECPILRVPRSLPIKANPRKPPGYRSSPDATHQVPRFWRFSSHHPVCAVPSPPRP